jgi:hypothetical protein
MHHKEAPIRRSLFCFAGGADAESQGGGILSLLAKETRAP